MSEITIRREDRGRKGRYIATVAGREGEAYIAFTHREEGVISADHTIAPDSLKGTGAAFALVEHLVARAGSGSSPSAPMSARNTASIPNGPTPSLSRRSGNRSPPPPETSRRCESWQELRRISERARHRLGAAACRR